jgi:hypothetical protein
MKTKKQNNLTGGSFVREWRELARGDGRGGKTQLILDLRFAILTQNAKTCSLTIESEGPGLEGKC